MDIEQERPHLGLHSGSLAFEKLASSALNHHDLPHLGTSNSPRRALFSKYGLLPFDLSCLNHSFPLRSRSLALYNEGKEAKLLQAAEPHSFFKTLSRKQYCTIRETRKRAFLIAFFHISYSQNYFQSNRHFVLCSREKEICPDHQTSKFLYL